MIITRKRTPLAFFSHLLLDLHQIRLIEWLTFQVQKLLSILMER